MRTLDPPEREIQSSRLPSPKGRTYKIRPPRATDGPQSAARSVTAPHFEMDRSPLIQALEGAGARMGARPEAPELDAVLTFGDVPAEYQAGRQGCVLFDASDRARVSVVGKDAASFLHRLLANDVRGLAPGTGNRNMLLTPKGKVTSLFDVAQLDESIELSAPPGTGAALAAALDVFLFAEDVQIEDSTATHAPLELAGPTAARVVEDALGVAPPASDHGRATLDDGTTVTRLDVVGAPGFRIDAGPDGASALWNKLVECGAAPAGVVARDILRVEAGAALFGVDVDDGIYPQEARLEDAFSLDKGCYIGQEVVAKIDTYGGLNKRLFALRVEHDDPIAHGTRLLLADGDEKRNLGVVTSWAYSFVLDTGLALGYVKRRHQELGTTFSLSGDQGTAAIVEFPAG
jgi:folate-binding protein YgfZ